MPWTLDRSADTWRVSGELSAEEARDLGQALLDPPISLRSLTLDLDDVELLDGVAVAYLVTALRRLAEQAPLTLVHCPQMLAHTLYKVDALGPILLRSPRQEHGGPS